MHRPREEVGVLTQHVGHHEGGQLGVGVGVEQAVVRHGVEGVAGLVLHEVQQRGVGMVGGCDGGDLVVFIPSTSATASALTGVALEWQRKYFLRTAITATFTNLLLFDVIFRVARG